MPDISLVKVATFDNPILAHIARSRLESEGIRAVLDGEHHVAMDWWITNAVGGVKLLVRDFDRDAALRILNETPEKSDDQTESELEGVATCSQLYECCPVCGSQETYRERLKRKWIYLSMLFLGIPIPILSNRLVCDSCDHNWTREGQEPHLPCE